MIDVRKLYAAANLQEAHLILGLLAEAGIRARVLNEYAQGGIGELPFTHTYPEIWIEREADLERARQVTTAYEHGPEGSGSIKCRNCGEENPGNFETCWQCGISISQAR